MALPGAIILRTWPRRGWGVYHYVCPCGAETRGKGPGHHLTCQCGRLLYMGDPDDVLDGTCRNANAEARDRSIARHEEERRLRDATTRICPYCTTRIARNSFRCPNCTSWLIASPPPGV